MAKSRSRGLNDAAREKARDALYHTETPLREVGALLRALDLIGAGMQGRGDYENGQAVEVVADCALDRLNILKKQWNTVFKGAVL